VHFAPPRASQMVTSSSLPPEAPVLRNPVYTKSCLIWCLVWGAGCELNLSAIPTEQDMSRSDAGERTGLPGEAGARPPRTLEAGAVEEGGVADAGNPRAGLKHKSCERSFPEAPPDEPIVATDPRGEPLFDAWRTLSCEDASTHPTCGEYDGSRAFSCFQCLGSKDLTGGICAHDVATSEPMPCVPVHDLAHDCWTCVEPEAKARACCLDLDVDCRTTADEALGEPGQVCARHADCEDGLACVDDPSSETKLCACPGAIPQLNGCNLPRVEVSL